MELQANQRKAEYDVTEGPVVHQGEAGFAKNMMGPSTGTVTVRQGDTIKNGEQEYKNLISIGYEGSQADQSHWLQFINLTLTGIDIAGNMVYDSGSAPTTGGIIPLSDDPDNPKWSVDSASSSIPFFDEGFANQRIPGYSTRMFDRAGGDSARPLIRAFTETNTALITSGNLIATFSTFLIQNNRAVYNINWSSTTSYSYDERGLLIDGNDKVKLIVSGGHAVTSLPEGLKVVLTNKYPAYSIVE